MSKLFMGIDPGANGAIALIPDEEGAPILFELGKHSASEWAEFLLIHSVARFCLLEQVSSRPGQGVASTFKFGRTYGRLEGMLISQKVRFERVTPQKWQTALGCRSKGDKNVTKQRAQELWPDTRITHATADALLIAEYARRMHG